MTCDRPPPMPTAYLAYEAQQSAVLRRGSGRADIRAVWLAELRHPTFTCLVEPGGSHQCT